MEMEEKTSEVLLGLGTSLAFEVMRRLAKEGKDTILGTSEEAALRRVLNGALSQMIDDAVVGVDVDMQEHVKSIIASFLKQEAMYEYLVVCAIDLNVPSSEELEAAFNRNGSDSSTLPVPFASLIQSFMVGLQEALRKEIITPNSALAQLVHARRLELTLSAVGEIPVVSRQLSSIIEILESNQGGHTEDLWSRFEAAKKCLNAVDVHGAATFLKDLRENHWSACPDELKGKVFDSLARIQELEGNTDEAVRLRGIAADFFSDRRDIARQRLLASFVSGDKTAAHTKASEMILDTPSKSEAWNLWLQSAPDSFTVDELYSQIPIEVKNDVDVLIGLSNRACSDLLFDKAEEFARQAFSKADKAPLVYYHLSSTLLRRYEGHLPDMMPSSSMKQLLEEVCCLTQKGLGLAGPHPPSYLALSLKKNRAFALRMLGRLHEHQQILSALHLDYPSELDVVLDYARSLTLSGSKSHAKQILASHLEKFDSDIATYHLLVLGRVDNDNNVDEIFAIIDKAIAKPFSDTFQRLALLHEAVGIALRANSIPKADTYCQAGIVLPEVLRFALQAEYHYQTNQKDDAVRSAKMIIGLNVDALDSNCKRYVAHLLERVDLKKEALAACRT